MERILLNLHLKDSPDDQPVDGSAGIGYSTRESSREPSRAGERECGSQLLTYRPELDGLRAVAIALVVLYHAGWGFPGGFVGVDVFFVLSGYLITGVILNDIRDGSFRYQRFLRRRISRVVPAASIMTLSVLLLGIFTLLPSDLVGLSKASISHQLGVSNVFFWRTQGYFAPQTEFLPLLHTWSLAIEEQFYLLFPLGFLIFRQRLKALGWLCVLALLVSAIASFWMTPVKSAASFYLLPTRAWEFLLGVVLWLPAFHTLATSKQNNQGTQCASVARQGDWVHNGLTLVGLSALLSSAWLLSATSIHPGPWTLLPCIATVIIVRYGDSRRSLVGKGLATWPMVAIGKLSYSIYLWHWPALAIARYVSAGSLQVPGTIVALLCSMMIAMEPTTNVTAAMVLRRSTEKRSR
ncbi:MAG: acyltransferase, partial [Planctomycetota bacterium]